VKEPFVLISLMILLTVTAFQVFRPCYLGSNLQAAFDELSSTIFYLDWHEEPQNFKTALKLFLENSKKPMKIAAFKVFHVNLQNFLFIIHSAYSIYSVLKSNNVDRK
jgi:hypothetical protein